ncbi:MAG: hypothetical protein AB1782_07500 [Cyanobacteriota bacterium]
MIRNLFLLILVLICFIVPLNTLKAENIVPSQADVYFAQQFYKVFRNFMDSNEKLVDNIQPENAQTNEEAICQYAQDRFVLTDTTINKLASFRPTKTFTNSYDSLIFSLKKDSSLLQEAKGMCNKGVDYAILEKFFKESFNTVEAEYDKTKNDFITTVKSWQQTYVDKVEEAYSSQ